MKLIVRGVRYSPNFSDTLISVDQLWHTSHIDTTFRDVCCLTFTANTTSFGLSSTTSAVPLLEGTVHIYDS